jgi:hypothetical protein
VTTKPPYVSRLRPVEELVDPQMRKLRTIVDEILEEIHAMTPEELIQYQINIGMRHPDGTLNWPEGEPVGMPYPGDYERKTGS